MSSRNLKGLVLALGGPLLLMVVAYFLKPAYNPPDTTRVTPEPVMARASTPVVSKPPVEIPFEGITYKPDVSVSHASVALIKSAVQKLQGMGVKPTWQKVIPIKFYHQASSSEDPAQYDSADEEVKLFLSNPPEHVLVHELTHGASGNYLQSEDKQHVAPSATGEFIAYLAEAPYDPAVYSKTDEAVARSSCLSSYEGIIQLPDTMFHTFRQVALQVMSKNAIAKFGMPVVKNAFEAFITAPEPGTDTIDAFLSRLEAKQPGFREFASAYGVLKTMPEQFELCTVGFSMLVPAATEPARSRYHSIMNFFQERIEYPLPQVANNYYGFVAVLRAADPSRDAVIGMDIPIMVEHERDGRVFSSLPMAAVMPEGIRYVWYSADHAAGLLDALKPGDVLRARAVDSEGKEWVSTWVVPSSLDAGKLVEKY